MSRRDYWVIAAIWVLVFVGAFVLAGLTADDDPSTDEGAGFGALAVLVAGPLTAVYLLIREVGMRREKQRIARLRGETERLVVPDARRVPRTREWWVDVIGAGAFWILGTVIVGVAVGLGTGRDAWIGGFLALAFLLVRHFRRSRRSSEP